VSCRTKLSGGNSGIAYSKYFRPKKNRETALSHGIVPWDRWKGQTKLAQGMVRWD
jgi:hypothetical protein